MRILNVAAYTFLALSVPQINLAANDNANLNQDNNLGNEDLITRLKAAKQKSQNEANITVSTP